MKYLIFALVFSSVLNSRSFAQNNWIRKEIDGGLFVSFPSEPDYKVKSEATVHMAKTNENIFMALAQRNIIPNYAEFINLLETKKTDIINGLLENAVKGKLAYTNSTGTPTNIRVGKYIGRDISYSALNPANGQQGMRHCKMFVVRNKMISFECFEMKSGSSSSLEQSKFLNSITTENIVNSYIAKSERSYFYASSDYSLKKSAYILKGEIVSSINEQNNFIYVNFKNASGVITRGWISQNDLTFYN